MNQTLYTLKLFKSIKEKIKKISYTPDLIITSYHGIPKKYFLKGDPYHCYCYKTTRLLEEKMKIKIPFLVTFQSRFGPQKWLTPYTDKTLKVYHQKE